MNVLTGVSSLHKWIDTLSTNTWWHVPHVRISHSELQSGKIYVIWHIICYLVSLGPEGNLIQWCREQVEWLLMIHSRVSKDKTPVCVVMLNVSLWLISHENRTQSNRKDSFSNQCFRPEIHGELLLAELVCGKEVLSSGCYKVTAPGSWSDLCLLLR